MILLLDLKNEVFSFALYNKNKEKICSFKTYSDKLKSQEEYFNTFKQFLDLNKVDSSMIEGSIFSSVQPILTNRIKRAVEALTNKSCLVVNNKIKTGLAIRMNNPNELGSDLLANAIGAINKYKTDCLIVDMSSVLSFTIVSEKREFIGGSLFPGLSASANMMFNNNALLMDTDLEIPKSYIGKSTKESINSGTVLGYVELIKSFTNKMEIEYKKPLVKILTGIDSKIVFNALFSEFEYEENLIFDGLFDIYSKNTL